MRWPGKPERGFEKWYRFFAYMPHQCKDCKQSFWWELGWTLCNRIYDGAIYIYRCDPCGSPDAARAAPVIHTLD